MMSPDDFTRYIEMLKAQGVVGPVEIDGLKFTIPAPVVASETKATPRKASADYDRMLFAATEGIPDEDEAS